MKNLAAGKLPLEDTWTYPEKATDGNVTIYDGKEGFAYSNLPSTYTIDFFEPVKIKCVRIFLWDGAGIEKVVKSRRKYSFNLKYSFSQDKSYSIFEANETSQGNGWFEFHFSEGIWLRYLKLECLDNTEIKEFHIIQFEAWDAVPFPIDNKNKQTLPSISKSIDDEYFQILIQNELKKGSEEYAAISRMKEAAESAMSSILKSKDAAQIDKSKIDFSSEAGANDSRATNWLVFGLVTTGVLLVCLSLSLWRDDFGKEILKSKEFDQYQESDYRLILFLVYYLGKVLAFSILIFIITWCLKNYRAEKHNYIINKHKAMSLALLKELMIEDKFSVNNREEIYREGLNLILRNENTGFNDKDEAGPNLITNISSIKPNVQ